MAKSLSFFPKFLKLPSSADPLTNYGVPCSTSLDFSFQNHRRKHFPLLVPSASSSLTMPINVDYLDKEFSSHGVSFEGIGKNCVVKMRLDNGSMASLVLPSGLITSYKPKMWHGGTMEVLHTTVSEGANGEVCIEGGVSMDLKLSTSVSDLPWSPCNWVLHDVRGGSDKFIQVELISINPKDKVEVKYLVTLQEEFLASELAVMNSGDSHVELTGSVISHLTVSTPEATFIVGLQGSNYYRKQPVVSDFSIIPPGFYDTTFATSHQSWAQKMLSGFLGSDNKIDNKTGETETVKNEIQDEGEENSDYAPMVQKMSRIYIHAPRQFTLIDRGRRNSIVIQRSGFEEFYLFSPGSSHEWYGKYAYVSVGPSATMTAITLEPGCLWRGSLCLHNPNL